MQTNHYTGITSREKFIALLLTDKIQKADCVVLLEGDGYERIPKACNLIKEHYAPVLIFSGGSLNLEYGSYPYAMCRSVIQENGISEESIILELTSMHTRQQAENVISICEENNWDSILLVATHYHQFRAFLTFLKVLEEKKLDRKIRIINAPENNANWFEINVWGRRYDLLDEEFKKIDFHSRNGHICNYETAIEYFKWKIENQKA